MKGHRGLVALAGLVAALSALAASPAQALTAPAPSARTAPARTLTAATVQAAPVAAPRESLLLVVDFSGSMLESDGAGSTRIASAKAALQTIITSLPADLDVGLRAYGHRVPSADKAAACQDTELVVPVGRLDRTGLSGTVDRLQALGETPIGLSLQQSVNDLPKDRPSTVILVSDGTDECFPDLGPEPCQVTRDLIASGVDLQLETIGLQVEPRGREQLECMAREGGGQFTSVEDAGLLADALSAARVRAARDFTPRGEPVTGAPALIDAPVLAPGVYTDAVLPGESPWYAVEAVSGQDVTARLTMGTADVPRTAALALEWQDERARRVDLRSLSQLPAGRAATIASSTGRINGTRTSGGAVRDPGTYYLNVRTAGFPDGADRPFVLELFVEDGQDDGPGATAPPQDESADGGTADGGTADGGTPAEQAPLDLPQAPDEGAGAGLLLGGAAVAALLAGVGYLVVRRRRRAQEGPPPPQYVAP